METIIEGELYWVDLKGKVRPTLPSPLQKQRKEGQGKLKWGKVVERGGEVGQDEWSVQSKFHQLFLILCHP